MSAGNLSTIPQDFVTEDLIKREIEKEVKKQLDPVYRVQNAVVDTTASLMVDIAYLSDRSDKGNLKQQKKIENLSKIIKFGSLVSGWAGPDSTGISIDVINKAADFLNNSALLHQPDVFPIGRNMIQFEYEKLNGDYLEIEIHNDKYEVFQRVNGNEAERTYLETSAAIRIINDFYS